MTRRTRSSRTPSDRHSLDPDDPDRGLLTGAQGYETIVAGQTVQPQICIDSPVLPAPADPSWFTVHTEPPAIAEDGSKACVEVTITGARDLSEHPFFFGWEAELDLSDAVEAIEAAGREANWVSWTPEPTENAWVFTATPTGEQLVAEDNYTAYRLTSGRTTAIRGTQSVTITACVNAS